MGFSDRGRCTTWANPEASHHAKSNWSPSLAVPVHYPIAAGLGAAAVVMPVLLGATPPSARFFLECSMATAALVWAVAKAPSCQTLLTALTVVICVSGQALPMPDKVLVQLATCSALAWKLASEVPAASWHTISVDPHATILAGYRLFLAASTVLLVSDVANRTTPRRILQAGIAAAALVIWGLGLAFPPERDNTRTILGSIDLSGPIEFWLTPLKRPLETAAFGYRRVVQSGADSYPVIDWGVGDGFGSYVISNHFSGAIVIALPMALAWLLFFTRDRLPAFVRCSLAVGVLGAALWTVGMMAGSRAGMGALLVSGTVFMACSAATPLGRRFWGGIAISCSTAVGIMAIVLYGGWQGLLQHVPAPLRKLAISLLTDSRAVATGIAKRLFWGSPWFGTGLGTYGELTVHSEANAVPWYFAHNDYAQWAAETGVMGIAVAVAVTIVFVEKGFRFYREPFQPERLLAAGAWGGLAGIAAHSAFDWNLHVPANAFLACIVAGLALTSTAPVAQAATASPLVPSRWRSRFGQHAVTSAFCITCLVSIGLLACDYQAARAEAGLRAALTAARMGALDSTKPLIPPELQQAVITGEQVADLDPSNPQLAALLGQANLVLSTEPQPIDQANERRQAAKEWFQRARQNSAVAFGVPIDR